MFELYGYTGAVIGAISALLQLRHTLRGGKVDGMSRLTWFAMVLSAALWVNYGIGVNSAPQVLANLPWLAMTWVVGRALCGAGRIPRGLVTLTHVGAVGLFALVLEAEPGSVTILGMMIAQAVAVPQLLATWRSDNVDGVSVGAWVAAACGGVCWMAYGIGTDQPPVTVNAALALTMNGLNALLLLAKNRRRPVGG